MRFSLKTGFARILFLAQLISAALLYPAPAQADWNGRITKIADGDILTMVTDDNRTLTFRLFAVDCPEPGQPYAQQARDLVKELVLDDPRLVTALEELRDQVGQVLAVVVLADGSTLNDRLLMEGLAWFDFRLCGENSFCKGMMDLEKQARDQRRGLWADQNPLPPWDFKASQSQ
ncbi:MAG: thermonuclease family protein [Desulfarculales bacterium]|jgi:endonuclease YncB( thermonuclease family)|nr:thermonuclease family protein [Desulfarculales bacterium]